MKMPFFFIIDLFHDEVIFMLFVLHFQVLAGEGRVYKCLFNHKFEEAMSERVSAEEQKIFNRLPHKQLFSSSLKHLSIPVQRFC